MQRSIVVSRISDVVWELAKPAAEELGLEIWDVEYLKEASGFVLRIYIDKERGDAVSIGDCEAFSRRVDPLLDEADPIKDSYTFEVSSAGAERQLKRPADFVRFMGSYAEVKLYTPIEGSKQYKGILSGFDRGAVSLTAAGDKMTFEKNNVASVRLSIKE